MLAMRMDLKLLNVNNKSISDNSDEREWSRSKESERGSHTFLSEFTRYLEGNNVNLDDFNNKEKTKLNGAYDDQTFKKCPKQVIGICKTETQSQNVFNSNSVVCSDLKELKPTENILSTKKTELTVKPINVDSNNKQIDKTLKIELERLPNNLVTELLAQYKQPCENTKLATQNNNLSKQNNPIKTKASCKKRKSFIKPSYVLLRRLPVQNTTDETNVSNDESQQTVLRTDSIVDQEIQERLCLTNGLLDQASQKSPSSQFSLDLNNYISADKDNVHIKLSSENKIIPVNSIQRLSSDTISDKSVAFNEATQSQQSITQDREENKLQQVSGLKRPAPNHLEISQSNRNTLEQEPRRSKRKFTRRKFLPFDKTYYLYIDPTKKNTRLSRTSTNNKVDNLNDKKQLLQRTRHGKVTNIEPTKRNTRLSRTSANNKVDNSNDKKQLLQRTRQGKVTNINPTKRNTHLSRTSANNKVDNSNDKKQLLQRTRQGKVTNINPTKRNTHLSRSSTDNKTVNPNDKKQLLQRTRQGKVTHIDPTKRNTKDLSRTSANNKVDNSDDKKQLLQRTRHGKVTKILNQKTQQRCSTSYRRSITQHKLKQTLIFNKNLSRRHLHVETKKISSKNDSKVASIRKRNQHQKNKKTNLDFEGQQLERELKTDKSETLVHSDQLPVKCNEHQKKIENTSFNNKENKYDINTTIKFHHLEQIASVHSATWDTCKGNLEVKDHLENTKYVLGQNPVQCPSSNTNKLPGTCRRNTQRSTELQDNLKESLPVDHNNSVDLKINKVKEKYISDDSQKTFLLISQQGVSISNNMELKPNNFFDSYLIIDSSVKVDRQEQNYKHLLNSTLKQQLEQKIPLQYEVETQDIKISKIQYRTKEIFFQPQRLASLALQSFFKRKVMK